MRYLFLAYQDQLKWDSLSPAERDTFDKACLANDTTLRKSGHLLGTERLQPGHTTLTLRLAHGNLSLTDGSLVEAKEHLVGFFLIKARDLNEAIQVAAKMPQARTGAIEVRPLAN